MFMFNLEFMNRDIIMTYNYQINSLLILLFEPSYKTKYAFFFLKKSTLKFSES